MNHPDFASSASLAMASGPSSNSFSLLRIKMPTAVVNAMPCTLAGLDPILVINADELGLFFSRLQHFPKSPAAGHLG
jgi:hypothetical protein